MLTATIVAIVLTVPGPFAQDNSLAGRPAAPPRDPGRPAPAAPTAAAVRDTAAMEAELAAKIAASPATLPLYYELSRLQERRGAFDEAEATLLRAREAAPSEQGRRGDARRASTPRRGSVRSGHRGSGNRGPGSTPANPQCTFR